MFIPLPMLIAAGVAFLVMAVQIVRLSRPRDPLLGGSPPVFRTAPLPARDISPVMPPTMVKQHSTAFVAHVIRRRRGTIDSAPLFTKSMARRRGHAKATATIRKA